MAEAGGYVEHLDTVNFNDAISLFGNYITQFEGIVQDVKRINETMLSKWKGEGCKAYELDCRQVQLNLKDISDIMYDLRDALVNAHAEYIKMDQSVSKLYDSIEIG